MLKKILIVLCVLIVIVVVAAMSWLSYMGFFSKVAIIEKQMGPLTFVYESHRGDYSKVGPVIEKVRGRLESEFGIRNGKAMGIYYSDPKTTKTEDLKSDVGFLLDKSDAAKADAIMKKMRVRIMFPKDYYTAEFPMKNNMSMLLGIIKVYPELGKYMKAKGYRMTPAIEIYEKDRIIYAFEIKK
jgi:effector-binding domain-containing protein